MFVLSRYCKMKSYSYQKVKVLINKDIALSKLDLSRLLGVFLLSILQFLSISMGCIYFL